MPFCDKKIFRNTFPHLQHNSTSFAKQSDRNWVLKSPIKQFLIRKLSSVLDSDIIKVSIAFASIFHLVRKKFTLVLR